MKLMKLLYLIVFAIALLPGCAGILKSSGAEAQIRSGVAAYKEQPAEVKALTRMSLDETLKPCRIRLWCPGEPLPDFGLPPGPSTTP